jgi:HSP20 family protein
MAIVRWLDQLSSMQRDLENMMSFFRPGVGPVFNPSIYPAINVYDDAESYIVRAEVPGVETKNLDVSVVGDTLTIKGKRQIPPAEKDSSYHRQERSGGEFRRAFTLPERVDGSKVMAEMKNGILEVRVPRAEEAKQRRIEIKAN